MRGMSPFFQFILTGGLLLTITFPALARDRNSMSRAKLKLGDALREQAAHTLPTFCHQPSETLSPAQQKTCAEIRAKSHAQSDNVASENWKRIEAHNGAAYAIDLNSISHQDQVVGNQIQRHIYAVTCRIESDACPPWSMNRLLFDCNGHYVDIDHGGEVMPAPNGSVAGQMAALACAEAGGSLSIRPLLFSLSFLRLRRSALRSHALGPPLADLHFRMGLWGRGEHPLNHRVAARNGFLLAVLVF